MIHPKVKERRFPLDPKGIGKRIRNARWSKGWRKADLAEVVGVKKSTVANWEFGWQIPRLRTMVQLSVHLRRSMDWLVGGVPRRGQLWTVVAPFSGEAERCGLSAPPASSGDAAAGDRTPEERAKQGCSVTDTRDTSCGGSPVGGFDPFPPTGPAEESMGVNK